MVVIYNGVVVGQEEKIRLRVPRNAMFGLNQDTTKTTVGLTKLINLLIRR